MSDRDDIPEGLTYRTRRRLAWILAAIALVLVLALTPPLISVNRLRRRITTSISQSLGRPVSIDSVELNLLPVPGFTLQNLVIGEDPSFGSEPVIRANTVHARLRVSSLWRRHVEFSTISFAVDDNGSAPSVNLVRRADGRWNIESILMHASQAEAAPTSQTKAGPAPRFPYIEVTGARINIKRGDEKLPVTLTDTDFALWLPSPHQWRIRLSGKPARTDITVSDAGELDVEATLQRAPELAGVAIETTLEWKRAPLGEASRLLFGNDAGWRGDGDAFATIHGTFGDAILSTQLRLTDVRRAEFIPARRMNVSVDCTAHLAITTTTLMEPACTLPANDRSGTFSGTIAATANSVQLAGFRSDGLRVGMTTVPNSWFVDWASLLSERIPATLTPTGNVSGSMQWLAASAQQPAQWQGAFHGVLRDQPATPAGSSTTALVATAAVPPRQFIITSIDQNFQLAPTNIAADKQPPLNIAGTLNFEHYTFELSGSATEAQLKSLAGTAPPLADGTEHLLPPPPAIANTPVRIDIACSRTWGADQTCIASNPPAAKPLPRHRRR